MMNNKNKISNRAIKKMHQTRRKLSFLPFFRPLTCISSLFLLIFRVNVAAQELNPLSGVRFKSEYFTLDLPDGFERRTVNTSGVILSVRYRDSFPTLNIVEAPGSSKYPSHLKVEQRVLESYRAVGIQQPRLIRVGEPKFDAVSLSEPLVTLGYHLNDDDLKAEVGFVDVKGRYFTITLVERASADGEELNAGQILRKSLKWNGPTFGQIKDLQAAERDRNTTQLGASLGSFLRQILGIVGILAGVFVLAKGKNFLWKRLFK